MAFSDMHHALLLMALGVGYIVCYFAKREDKVMKTVGFLIGTFIIAISAVILLVNALFDVRFSRSFMGTAGMGMPRQQMMRERMPPSMRAPSQRK